MKPARDGVATASRARLRYVCCTDAGITRVRRGKSFAYRLPDGKWLSDAAALERRCHRPGHGSGFVPIDRGTCKQPATM